MRQAVDLGVTGWVKNRRDGKVEVLCEGPSDKVQLLADWCKSGPEGAFVSHTDITWEEYVGEFQAFQITYS